MRCESTIELRKTLSAAAIVCVILSLLLMGGSAEGDDRATGDHEDVEIHGAIVQIYTLSSNPYYLNPWLTLPENSNVGSGSIIEGGWILTNAHVVANPRHIEVRKALDSTTYRARVQYVSHEADLALLSVEDEEFYEDLRTLELAPLPEKEEKLLIYGFPDGDTLTIVDGILSDVGHRKYIHSSSYLLAGEILSDITTGHSGGPVIHNDRLVGVVMQANKSGSIAHMVPGPVIEHFLEDVDDGIYDGFPDLGLVTQNLVNPSMKLRCGMTEDQSGIVVNHVISGSPAEEVLMKDDVLLAVNGYKIGDDGTVELRPDIHAHYTYSLEMNHIGDRVDIEFMRDGRVHTAAMTLNKKKEDFQLIPGEQYDKRPRYFVFGGIVFSPVTRNYISECREVPEELMVELSRWPTRERRELVVALLVLPDEVNIGYQELSSWKVSEVNGKRFRDFSEFYDMVTSSLERYVIFGDDKGYQVVIDRLQAEKNHQRVLQTYNIRDDRSPDLKLVHAGPYPPASRYQ